MGALEFGFTYTTIMCEIIMTVAFYEMVKLQSQKDKEAKIVIKSKLTEWYFFACFNFIIIPKTWLTLAVLKHSDMAPEPGSFLSILLYEYHNFISFCLMTLGMMLFVVSLQEGFYSYQFKMLGWTLLSSLLIVGGCSGLLLSLWKCRMWFFYTVMCISIHNAIDHLVSQNFPWKTPMLYLKPEATLQGFIGGAMGCFAFFTLTVTKFVDIEWFMQVPMKISLVPFD